jgi:two-component system alkaline phosphatase synthesis response regulator PhoP
LAHVLLVDDEVDLIWGVRYALTDEGYEVAAAYNGTDALSLARERRPDLIVLDVVMPGLDGIGLCHELRRDAELASVPILFLSARGAIADRVKGLDEGGDDYLGKPFDLQELKARIRALLRRSEGTRKEVGEVQHVLIAGPLRLDQSARSLEVEGVPVSVTPAEFALLAFMMAHPGEVFSARQLLDRVWGYPPGTSDPGLVRWHVKNLREKIEQDPAKPIFIRTVPRYGYILDRRLNAITG